MSAKLNESQIIDNIRRFGDEIFNYQPEESLDFSISDTDSNYQDKFIRPLIISTTASKKNSLKKSQYGSNYKSPYSKNLQFSTCSDRQKESDQKISSNSSGQRIRRKIFEMYDEEKRIEEEKK